MLTSVSFQNIQPKTMVYIVSIDMVFQYVQIP